MGAPSKKLVVWIFPTLANLFTLTGLFTRMTASFSLLLQFLYPLACCRFRQILIKR
jgi:hypothetical protein